MTMHLDHAIGLSRAYRTIWAREYARGAGVDLLCNDAVLAALDSQSRDLLALSNRLASYIADEALSPFLHCDMSAAMALLPQASRDALTRFGYDVDAAGSENSDTDELSDETRSHFGLRYLEEGAKLSLKNRDIVDAGSFDGRSALFFLESYAPSRVLCFEPDPKNYEKLQENTAVARSAGRLIARNAALSNHVGLATMQSAGMGTSQTKAAHGFSPKITVNTVTLDGLLADDPTANIGLIKLDVEGDAVPVLRGAEHTIRTHRPILIVSFYHTPGEFMATLPYLIETQPDYAFSVRKTAPNLFKEHVIIAEPRPNGRA